MLLGALGFLSRAKQQAILDPVKSHPAAEGPDALGILFQIAALLQHLEPDTTTSHPLQPHEVLERNGKVPATLGILGRKTATNKDGRQGRFH